MKTLIQNGHVIDPANHIDAIHDVAIDNDIIISIGKTPDGYTAERIIDAKKYIVCPGLIDLRAHLREPGQEHKATIASETRAAAASGITTLCCPPDTQPVIDTPAVATLIREQAQLAGMAKVLPLGALTLGLAGKQLSTMQALKEAGCVGVSNAMYPLANSLILKRAMEYAATHQLTVFLHAEDAALADQGCVHNGAVSTRLGLPGIPTAAETVAVATAIALVEETSARIHFSMLSTARAVRMIARARFDGLPVSADVSAHHLHLTEIDVLDFDSQCHVRPPLRSQRDREALCEGLLDGTISAICSDHQPHEADAKLAPFSATATGISALETLLPLALNITAQHPLTLSEIIAKLTHGPATILGIPSGTLSVGSIADICIFDPEQYWLLTDNNMRSRGHNTPFLNWELKGRVQYTFLNGECIFELQHAN